MQTHTHTLPDQPLYRVRLKNYLKHDHRLCGSGSTVVMMTSTVNGKTENLTPCRSEPPENIEAKLGVNDNVMDPYKLQPCQFLWN